MAEQYLHAAKFLAEAIKRQEQEDFRLASPVLFLYRHALELALKALLRNGSTHHRLDARGADLKTLVREKYQQEVPGWITARLNELAALAPGSMAFRYGEEKYGGGKQFSPAPGEMYVGVGRLQASINEPFTALAARPRRCSRPFGSAALRTSSCPNKRHRRHSQFANSKYQARCTSNLKTCWCC